MRSRNESWGTRVCYMRVRGRNGAAPGGPGGGSPRPRLVRPPLSCCPGRLMPWARACERQSDQGLNPLSLCSSARNSVWDKADKGLLSALSGLSWCLPSRPVSSANVRAAWAFAAAGASPRMTSRRVSRINKRSASSMSAGFALRLTPAPHELVLLHCTMRQDRCPCCPMRGQEQARQAQAASGRTPWPGTHRGIVGQTPERPHDAAGSAHAAQRRRAS
jgi:hypothetical protein